MGLKTFLTLQVVCFFNWLNLDNECVTSIIRKHTHKSIYVHFYTLEKLFQSWGEARQGEVGGELTNFLFLPYACLYFSGVIQWPCITNFIRKSSRFYYLFIFLPQCLNRKTFFTILLQKNTVDLRTRWTKRSIQSSQPGSKDMKPSTAGCS